MNLTRLLFILDLTMLSKVRYVTSSDDITMTDDPTCGGLVMVIALE